jgi:ATP-binding cassette subfamily B protein
MKGSVAHLVRQGLTVYLRPYWREQLVLAFSIIPSVALTTMLPLGLGVLLDKAIPSHDGVLMLKVLIALGALLVVATLCETLEAFLRAGFGYEIKAELRRMLFEKLQQLPLSYHDRVQPGEIAALFAKELISVRNAYRDLVVDAGKSLLQIATCLLVMVRLNWQGALILMLILPWIVGHQKRSLEATEAADFRDKMLDAQVASAIQDQMSLLPLVRAFGLSQLAVENFALKVLARPRHRRTLNQYNRPLIREILASPAYMKASMTVNSLQNPGYLLAMVVGGGLAYQGLLSVGNYSALLGLVYGLGQALGHLAVFLQGSITAANALERIERILNEPVRQAGRLGFSGPIRGQVVFDNVQFSYGSQPQLSELSFEVQPRTMVAFVGRSGGGKSTILRLLLGLYPANQGQVCLDGVDVSQLAPTALRGHVGVVTQDLYLFNASIKENMILAKPDASQPEIEAAAKATEIHDFVMQLPKQYDTLVGEGGRHLSPGQRQRLALARAMLCNPALLLLDEVTSALDPETEKAIYATLRRLAQDRTVVLVTHRLALVTQVDRIFVIEKGQLAQQGSHDLLLHSPGLYRQQWLAQSGFTISQNGRHAEVSQRRLQAIPLFEELPAEMLDRLAQRFVSDHFEAGESICLENQPGDRFFMIVRGRARVLAQGSSPEPLHVATLEDGDYFGEDALLDQTTYSTGVVAELACLVLVLQRADFLQLVGDSDRVLQSLQDTAVGRSLTLFGRRGRRASSVPATWDLILED